MRLQFRCGCGMLNHNWGDWVSHWKYGNLGKWHAVKLFLMTKVQVVR